VLWDRTRAPLATKLWRGGHWTLTIVFGDCSGPRIDSFNSRVVESGHDFTGSGTVLEHFPYSISFIHGFSLHSFCLSQSIGIASGPLYPAIAETMADPVAIQDEITAIEQKIEEAQAQLKDAKARLRKAQDASFVQPGANMSAEEKMALIKVNLAEVLNPEIMDEALKKQGHLKVYWGTATTGRPHCGYVCCCN